MKLEDIYEFFENDTNLLKYFDPQSNAKDNLEASIEIYNKLIEKTKEGNCVFKKNKIGYIFYSKKPYFIFSRKLLISFCIKPEYRNKENLNIFGDFIKAELGKHFKCCLYNVNTRGIRFLQKIGMKKVKSNNLITLLSI